MRKEQLLNTKQALWFIFYDMWNIVEDKGESWCRKEDSNLSIFEKILVCKIAASSAVDQ